MKAFRKYFFAENGRCWSEFFLTVSLLLLTTLQHKK